MILTTHGLEQSIANGWPVAALAFIDHPDGVVHAWSGVGDLVYGGNTYQGVGAIGRITGIGGDQQLAIRSVVFELRGVPPHAATWLNKDIQNRSAKAWIAGLDSAGANVNGEPWQIVDGRCDYQESPIGEGGTTNIKLFIVEPVIKLERAKQLAFTPEWLNDTYRGAGDRITGLDLLSDLESKTVNWTRT